MSKRLITTPVFEDQPYTLQPSADPGFAVKEFIEPDTGKAHRVYTYKRKPCKRVVLTSKLAEQLAGYILIEKDLRSVLVWLAEINARASTYKTGKRFSVSPDRAVFDLVKGLFVASLTFYGKCFTKCEGRPVKLERAQLDPSFRELHDDCMAYRHNFAAHSGAKKLEHVTVVLISPVKYGKHIPFNIFKEVTQPDVFWPVEGDLSLPSLVEHVQSLVKKKIELLNKKIQTEEVAPMANSYWPPKD